MASPASNTFFKKNLFRIYSNFVETAKEKKEKARVTNSTINKTPKIQCSNNQAKAKCNHKKRSAQAKKKKLISHKLTRLNINNHFACTIQLIDLLTKETKMIIFC